MNVRTQFVVMFVNKGSITRVHGAKSFYLRQSIRILVIHAELYAANFLLEI